MQRLLLTFIAAGLFLLFSASAFSNEKNHDIAPFIAIEKQKYTAYQDLLFTLLNEKQGKINYIKSKLKQTDLPENYYLIPLIESRYNTQATSPVGAAGLWQIMPATAIRFGLQVDNNIDQRRDFELSTDAAISYLRVLSRRFSGNESLILAAYNAGEGRLSSALKSPLASADKFSSIKLPTETKHYVYRYYALIEIIEQHNKTYYLPSSKPVSRERLTSFESLFENKKVINLNAIPALI